MPLTWIDGREIAKKWKENAAQRAQALTEKGVTPHLAVIVAGDNPASQVYVRNKENACLRAGIHSTILRLPESCTQEELESAVVALNADQSVHGILVQLPLPKGLDEARVLALIDPEKDVDGFHAMNAGKLMSGQPGFVPCTPLGVMKLLEAYNIPTRGRHAVVIGRSNIVGKPMAMLLLAADATVIDVGINRVDGTLVGDVNAEEAAQKAAYLTPVPGGVGQMTIAMLLSNTLDAAERHDR